MKSTTILIGMVLFFSTGTVCRTQDVPNLPLIDISQQTYRHIVIAQGTEDIYQGHPTTLLMPDKRTMYCVWSVGHGGPAGPMAVSRNAGITWERLLPSGRTTGRK